MLAFYIEEIHSLIKESSPDECDTKYALHFDIMSKFKIDVHQFYRLASENDSEPTKTFSMHPSLQTFLKRGLKCCLENEVVKTIII